MKYKIELKPKAAKDLKRLTGKDYALISRTVEMA